MSTAIDLTMRAQMACCPRCAPPAHDSQLAQISAASLRLAACRDLPVALAQAAGEAATLIGGVCQVRFTPTPRVADTCRAVAGPQASPCITSGEEGDDLYAALVARLAGADDHGQGAALLLTPLVAHGRRIGTIEVVLAAADDTDLNARQRQLHALAAHAALAIDSAHEIARLRASAGDRGAAAPGAADPLLALIAHDLRDPLTAISSSMQLLIRSARSTPELSSERVARLAGLADAAVARIEAQLVALSPSRPAEGAREVDLVHLAGLMAHFYQQTTGRHQLSVTSDLPELSGPWARPHIERVIANLLSNGIKYSPQGGAIQLVIGCEEDAHGRWATLEVQNEGIGIPLQDMAQIGRPGRRARNVGAITGTGFGLASVQAIIEQYGGTFALQSALGAATTVHIRLPLELA